MRLVSTINLAGTYTAATHTLELTAAGHLAIDGVQTVQGERVLLVGQTDATQNGIYTVEAEGDGGAAELRRAPDFDDNTKIFPGVVITVNAGIEQASSFWKLISDYVNLDTAPLEFRRVNPVAAASKYAEDIVGDNSETEFEIEHMLGTTDVAVNIRNLSTNGIVLTDVTVDDANTVTVGFADPPTPAQHYRVIVMG